MLVWHGSVLHGKHGQTENDAAGRQLSCKAKWHASLFAYACSHSPGCKRQAQLNSGQGLLAVLADICVDGAELVSAPTHWTLGLVVHLQQSGKPVNAEADSPLPSHEQHSLDSGQPSQCQ